MLLSLRFLFEICKNRFSKRSKLFGHLVPLYSNITITYSREKVNTAKKHHKNQLFTIGVNGAIL